MRVGICGLGTVGSGLFNLFASNEGEIARKLSAVPQLVQVGCRRDHPDCDLSTVDVTRDVFDVARNPDIEILVELIGGVDTARELVLEAINNGKHIVTANKALIALHGDEVFEAADMNNVSVRYEAAIAGGIPIVKAIREGLAGNRIQWLAGIVNGTSNFILSEMAKPGSSRSFDEVLKEAQQLGYAEADPTFDVEGIDAAHKLTILATIAFGIPLNFAAMYTEGISAITTTDIQLAAELGYRIRHLGIARRLDNALELRVHPALVPSNQILAQIDGVMNAVMVGSDAAGPTLYCGAGAGAGPTASAVMADVIDVVRSGNQIANPGFTGMTEATISHIDSIVSSYYLRLDVQDEPGVLAHVSSTLGEHDVSIEVLNQKDTRPSDAQIVIVTNEVTESSINAAIRQLGNLEQVTSAVTKIRVADFQ